MLTDVAAVQLDYGTPMARSLGDIDAAALRGHSFAAGSMGPKVDAACRFAERTGGIAGIGALADAAAILRGERGTRVHARTRAAA
jgi:carbamate kinase